MLRVLVFFCALNAFVLGINIINPGPKYPPTKGNVWPKPQHEKRENLTYLFNPSDFHVKVTNETCSILTNAIQRYIYVVRGLNDIAQRHQNRTQSDIPLSKHSFSRHGEYLKELRIELTLPCEDFPHFKMDEKYDLTVSVVSSIRTASIWGALRGLETFSQMFYLSDDNNEILINATTISDYPRYTHRGILLDTSRHYISMENILIMLDAMSFNKMNVFHWHIVDDQSFPYESKKYPDLSRLGAYHPTLVYSRRDVQKVIDYATDRGIRVIPEFDVPGHTRSWGLAYPVLTKCYKDNVVVGYGPMNPIRNVTYKLLGDLLEEVQDLFPDKYLHVGGDEVDLSCWASNPELLDYMSHHNLTSVKQLHALFMSRAIPMLQNRSTPIVWQEVFDNNVPLPNNTLVQVWKRNPIPNMISILKAGHRVLFSSSWYLDQLGNDGLWQTYYTFDPRQMVEDEELAKNIVGGEACMWGEMADDTNLISRVWPRASAVAERLWSGPLNTARVATGLKTQNKVHGVNIKDTGNIAGGTIRERVPLEAYHRLEEHTCRLRRRGVRAEPPSGPGYCLTS